MGYTVYTHLYWEYVQQSVKIEIIKSNKTSSKFAGYCNCQYNYAPNAFCLASAFINSSHSTLLFLTSTMYKNIVLKVPLFKLWVKLWSRENKTYKPKRKAKGMLLLLPDAVMIADDTNGPINADVFPTCVCRIRLLAESLNTQDNIPLRIVQKKET